MWVNEQGLGFLLSYPSISLHAISRDVSAYPKPCLYIMFDGKLEGKCSELTMDILSQIISVI
jgi:nucleotide-sensitive chloride channel 1A